MNYSREHLQDFFKNHMAMAIEHFENDHDHQERAHQYALETQETGYITFKKFFGGRRYYWIEKGVSEELEPLECFLKGRNTSCLKTTKGKSLNKS
jgi:hypothetical protein